MGSALDMRRRWSKHKSDVQGDFTEERLLQLEKDWIVNMGTFGSLGVNTRDQLISRTRRDWGR